MPVTCAECGSEELDGSALPNGQIQVVCAECGEGWLRGEPKRVYENLQTIDDIYARFPSRDSVTEPARERADRLKTQFLGARPSVSPTVGPF